MEGLRSEVSQKIKKAIQAKLLELGVTIDEELPDYVMVLVVNKKSKQQMEEDLSLFLQGKTSIFVEWLLEILGRLQTMSMQTKEKQSKPSQRPPKRDVAAKPDKLKRSASSDQPEGKKRRRSDGAARASVAGLHPGPQVEGTPGPVGPRVDDPADPASPVHTAPAPAPLTDPETPSTDPETPAAGEAQQQQPTDRSPPDVSPDQPGREPSTARDGSEPRRSNSRESSKSRSNSRESSKSRSKSRDSSKSRSRSRDSSKSRSRSRDSSKSRHSESRDSSRSRRSASRDCIT